MDFLKRELIGGLLLIVALATFLGGDFKFTRVVLALFALGAVWTLVVVAHALLTRRTGGQPELVGDRRSKTFGSKGTLEKVRVEEVDSTADEVFSGETIREIDAKGVKHRPQKKKDAEDSSHDERGSS
jgi:hypothetical protein